MGSLESLRELSIAQSDHKKKKEKKKKRKEKRERENKAFAIIPWSFNLMGIPVNFEIVSHCTLELI
jgi:hypothetical protein